MVVNKLRTVVKLFDNFEEIVSSTALLTIVIATSWNVTTRYVTETPASWTSDITTIAFAWLIFLGSSLAFKYHMHISIDIFLRIIPSVFRGYVTLLSDLIVLLFLAYAAWLSLLFCIGAMDNPMPILRFLPRTVIYAAGLVGFICMFLRYLRATKKHWADFSKNHRNMAVYEEKQWN